MYTAKRWARERNFAIYRLKGILSSLVGMSHRRIFTYAEEEISIKIQLLLEQMFRSWKENNKESKSIYTGEK